MAPVVGPLLDRFRHGRRYALALTLVSRAFLAWVHGRRGGRWQGGVRALPGRVRAPGGEQGVRRDAGGRDPPRAAAGAEPGDGQLAGAARRHRRGHGGVADRRGADPHRPGVGAAARLRRVRGRARGWRWRCRDASTPPSARCTRGCRPRRRRTAALRWSIGPPRGAGAAGGGGAAGVHRVPHAVPRVRPAHRPDHELAAPARRHRARGRRCGARQHRRDVAGRRPAPAHARGGGDGDGGARRRRRRRRGARLRAAARCWSPGCSRGWRPRSASSPSTRWCSARCPSPCARRRSRARRRCCSWPGWSAAALGIVLPLGGAWGLGLAAAGLAVVLALTLRTLLRVPRAAAAD